MPQIWMTYGEIAGLLGCNADEARAQAIFRSLDRKKSRDGLTRVKLDLHWAAKFFAAVRDGDQDLDQTICDLQMVGREMARNSGLVTRQTAKSREFGSIIKRRV